MSKDSDLKAIPYSLRREEAGTYTVTVRGQELPTVFPDYESARVALATIVRQDLGLPTVQPTDGSPQSASEHPQGTGGLG